MSNLDFWDKVKETDPKYTKPAKIGGMTITAIAPQYQIMLATEQFGVYGSTWGFKSIDLDYSLIPIFKLVVFKGTFFHPSGEFQIINSSKMYMDRAENMVDADFAKKIETDALTKALSKLGFNADVFMGRFDDTKYVMEMQEKFNKPEPDENDMAWVNMGKEDKESLNQITDPVYKTKIQLFIKEGY
tara:strand:- start:803 stop:1363 length:561 start_codon:yes stop_codon:yes gene_type:complete